VTGVVPIQSERIDASAVVSSDSDQNPDNNESKAPPIQVLPSTIPPETDVRVTMDKDFDSVFPGEERKYVVVVSNPSDHDAVDARLTVDLDPSLQNPSWIRTEHQTQGVGEIDELGIVPPGQSLTYEVSYTVGRKVGEIVSSAAIMPSASQLDTNLENNVSVETDRASMEDRRDFRRHPSNSQTSSRDVGSCPTLGCLFRPGPY
jgi:hypothetical protein